jgi:hypothetical protein
MVILFAAVVLGLYAAFGASTVWALLRRRHEASAAGHRRAWRLTVLSMVFLPVASAVATVTVLVHTESVVFADIVLLNFLGGVLIGAGLLLRTTLPSTWALLLRLSGWSIIAGVALIPSFLVFLLPIPSLLAFLVPGDYGANAASRPGAPDASHG